MRCTGGVEIDSNALICGDAIESLRRTIPDESIDCVVTSPPYWMLRDYGKTVERIWDGKPGCQHQWQASMTAAKSGGTGSTDISHWNDRSTHFSAESQFCALCGAWRGQLGLEPTIDLYIEHLCDVFDEVRRVLKPTGTCWVNLGDTYLSGGPKNSGFNLRWHGKKYASDKQSASDGQRPIRPRTSLPRKSLALVPFRFALAMVERGWILRNVIIWHKTNPIPCSAKDRFGVDFEYVFFFVKSQRYWFEQQFEPYADSTKACISRFQLQPKEFDPLQHKPGVLGAPAPHQIRDRICRKGISSLGRRKRCVWTFGTRGFPGRHFATFPERLVETPIRAGCPEHVCVKCGEGRRKLCPSTQYVRLPEANRQKGVNSNDWFPSVNPRLPNVRKSVRHQRVLSQYFKEGYSDCSCGASFEPGVVLDPFCGTGTTGIAALKLGRRFICIELNPEYIQMAKEQLSICGNVSIIQHDDANATID